MWNRRFYLFIGTKGGNVLRGVYLRSSRRSPAALFTPRLPDPSQISVPLRT